MRGMRRIRVVLALVFVVWIVAATSALAATYYVNNQDGGASDINPGTQTSPWLTIQHAADMVTAGDTVIVKPGVYSESVRLSQTGTATAPIVFKGESGAVLDGSETGDYYGFSNWDPNQGWGHAYTDFIRIEGFEIRSFSRGIRAYPAYRNWETGESLGANGWSVVNNVIHDCWEGVSLWGGSTPDAGNIVVGNLLYNNSWTDIHTHQYSVVERNVALSHVKMENVRACTAYYREGATHKVNNNTVMNGTYGISVSYPGSEYKNNIIMNIKPYGWDGQTGGFAFLNRLFYVNMDQTNISYNDLFDNYSEAGNWSAPLPLPSNSVGNLSVDPQFINNTGDHTGDYHLTAASPCIDAGDPADPVPPGSGSRIDIGAYEFGKADIPSLIASKHLFYDQGLINNKGILTALDAKLNAAMAALGRGQVKTAQNNLNAFINEAQAQAGKHVADGAAQALIEDAQMILKSIEIMEARKGAKK